MAVRRKSLSTGDIARYCQVTPATVVNWIKAGKLDVYTTPGGQYRMDVGEFVKFLQENRLPIPEELQPSNERRVLLIDNDPEVLERATQSIAQQLPSIILEESDNGFDGLIKMGSFKPHATVLDLSLPNIDVAEICRRLRANQDTRNMFVIAVGGEDADSELVRRVRRVGVDAFLNRPLRMDELGRALARVLKLSLG
ncbi:MAG: response regulator [Planctomycetes bacterium]|nr:response regulator [Planctomycetota bacterium]MCA8934795.1 response regulator [Planctomycetota bacterium]